MRKNNLIKLLQDLPGNPEVALWNGYVGDYNHIDPVISPLELAKECREQIAWRWKHDDDRAEELSTAEIEKQFRKQEWETVNQFYTEDQLSRVYGKHLKTIYVLDSRQRGKEMWSRDGTMEY